MFGMDRGLGVEGVSTCVGWGLGWVHGKGQTLAYLSRRSSFQIGGLLALNPNPRGFVTNYKVAQIGPPPADAVGRGHLWAGVGCATWEVAAGRFPGAAGTPLPDAQGPRVCGPCS